LTRLSQETLTKTLLPAETADNFVPMKKITLTLSFFLAFLFANILPIAGVAYANAILPPLPTICINADGSIDPPTVPIQRNGNIYSLTDNITNYEIIIDCDNIVLDGKGFTLKGRSLQDCAITLRISGMEGPGKQNVTIMNLRITEFNMGIYAAYPSNCVVTSNTLECFNCIHFSPHCSNNQITNNNLIRPYGRGTCIWIWGSDNVISGNTFTKFRLGIEVFDGENNVISDNYFSDVEEPIELFEANARETTILENNIVVTHEDAVDSSSPTSPTITPTPTPLPSPTSSPELKPTSEVFPVVPVAASIAISMVVAACLLVYFKKLKH
jgi:parallel beta-helix repeat protein